MAPPWSDRRDVVVVGGGIIGLAVGLAAAAAGLGVALVDPEPGRGSTWAAAGMLAPVAEAHFGEEALAGLNVAAVRAWPGFAARPGGRPPGRPVHFRADGTLLVAVDPSDRAATDRVLAFHRAIGLPAVRLGRPGLPGVRAPAGPGHQRWGRAARRPPGRQPRRGRRARGRLPGRRGGAAWPTRSTGSRSAGGRVAGRAPGTGRTGPRRIGRGGGREPVGRPRRAARGRPAPGPAGPGGHGPPAGAGRCPPTATDGPGARPRAHLLPGPPRRRGPGRSGPPWRSGDPTCRVPLGGLADLLDDARRVVPALDEYAVVETASGLRPGPPTTARSSDRPVPTAWWWPPATSATASCWPR